MKELLLKKVAVIGAAGKMGKGISLLLLQEIARAEVFACGGLGTSDFSLVLVDHQESALLPLRDYLRSHLTKYAEKQINFLRECYANCPTLVSNEEIIKAFVEGALDRTRIVSDLHEVKLSDLIFEAIIEDVEAKCALFTTLEQIKVKEPFYLTNTSSIPISLLNERADLHHRIAGFHFYNPPTKEKLIEIILLNNDCSLDEHFTLELAKRLHKVVVKAQDVAGFIGNGYFIREALFACRLARDLVQQYQISTALAIYLINRVTQEFLIRPMGIFQVMDFVGIAICNHIAQIMRTYLPDSTIQEIWWEELLDKGILGGEDCLNPYQRSGFLSYENQIIKGIYAFDQQSYQMIEEQGWMKKADELLGPLPNRHQSWKKVQQQPQKEPFFQSYFQEIFSMTSLGSRLASTFLSHSKAIAKKLIETGAASSLADVSQVLKNGFYHLYGVDEPWQS